jgi:hypothetical protein
VVGVQPGVEDSDGIIEAVRTADRDERLSAADSARPGKGVEGREAQLCLGERELSLVAQPRVPARRCFLEPPRLLVERQQ